MHAFNTLLTLPLVFLAAAFSGALASPTLHPRLHDLSAREFEYHHHTTTTTHWRHQAEPTTVAAPPAAKRNPVGNCNTAGQHCCNTVANHSSSTAGLLSSLLSLGTLSNGDLLMGIDCTPLAPILSAAGQCTGTMVCCSGSQTYNGLINVGCSPIEL